MLIVITKKELVEIISNYCLDYGVLCDSFIEKNYGYIGYDRFSDAKNFQWNYEELEKLTEEELYYGIYQKLWRRNIKMTPEENLQRLQSQLWRYEAIFKDTEKKYLETKENYEGLKANYKKAYEELYENSIQDIVDIESPRIPMKVFQHLKNSTKGTYWYQEACEGIFRSSKYQTLKEFLDDKSWVSKDDEPFQTDIERIQIVTEKNFIEPTESEWVPIEDLQKFLGELY